MQQHFEHRFDASPERVLAMYSDAEFAAARAVATGAIESDVVIDGEVDNAFTVAIRRTMPTDDVQPDFKGFVGDTISVRYTEAWEAPDGDGRVGTFALEIVGAPARAAGAIAIAPEGSGSIFTIDTTVSTSMPFLAQLVTEAVAEALERGIAQEFETADAWLARA